MFAMLAAMLPACFGYNRSAKGWSYVGDSMLIAAGGATIAVDVTAKPGMACEGCDRYTPPFSGYLVAGVVLAVAGLTGLVLNATRPNLKNSSH